MQQKVFENISFCWITVGVVWWIGIKEKIIIGENIALNIAQI